MHKKTENKLILQKCPIKIIQYRKSLIFKSIPQKLLYAYSMLVLHEELRKQKQVIYVFAF